MIPLRLISISQVVYQDRCLCIGLFVLVSLISGLFEHTKIGYAKHNKQVMKLSCSCLVLEDLYTAQMPCAKV